MLRVGEWTLDELARNFVVPKKIIIDDLEHITRSATPASRLVIHPPTCDHCGYRFKGHARFSDPSAVHSVRMSTCVPNDFGSSDDRATVTPS